MADKSLAGVKIIEFSSMISGPYAAKMMADMGACVIKIEKPGTGDPSREHGPFPGDDPHPEKSGLFLYVNTNKKSITLDPSTEEGKKIFIALCKEADVLVEDLPPGGMEALGLSYEILSRENPGLIHAAITPYGQTGPDKDLKARELNTVHASGQGFLMPLPSYDQHRAPVKAGGHVGDYDPALVAVVPIMAAVFHKNFTGEGQFIDLSKQEALLSMQRVESSTYPNSGFSMSRWEPMRTKMPGGIMETKDGFVVSVTPLEHQWQSMLKLMGDPEWGNSPMCENSIARSENYSEIQKHMDEWMSSHTKEEIFRKGQSLSIPITPINTPEDVVKSPQFKARGFFGPMEHPEAGKIDLFPTAPYRFSKTPWALENPAPLLGQHNMEVYGKLGYDRNRIEALEKDNVI